MVERGRAEFALLRRKFLTLYDILNRDAFNVFYLLLIQLRFNLLHEQPLLQIMKYGV